MSVTKRRYNNGFYISYNEGKHNTTAVKEKTESRTISKINTETAIQEQKKVSEAVNEKHEQDNTTFVASFVASNEKKEHKIILRQQIKQLKKQKEKIVELRSRQIKQQLFETKKTGINSSDGDDALSLFWIIILVLLILWAIGALAGGFGLGGFINLLLVIALVLFILWLLRLI
jgi:hypothetical protein